MFCDRAKGRWLHNRLARKWPGCRLQRCTEHKRANLLQHCPAHARRELRRDYNRIVYAKNGIDARKAYDELVAKWTPLAPAVVRSLEEAGNQLLTFYEFPRAMWKSIRTTNALENLNREFRRRTKTQASFSSKESAVRFAVWAYRLWPDSTTTHRRLPTSERGSRTRGGRRLI